MAWGGVLAASLRVGVVAGVLVGAGCQPKVRPDDPGVIVNPGPLPSYQSVAKGYNERIAGLERLWTYTSVRFWVTDRDGKEQTEALDANLQVILPSRFSLRLDKVNSTYAILGSNDERYWWIELGNNPRALWGAHAAVDSSRLAEIGGEGGLPVHPLDMIDLLGITRLPTADGGVGVGDGPEIAWSADGKQLVVTAASRGGQRRLWLDPKSYAPSRIELLGAEGAKGPEAAAWSEISAFIPVEVKMGAPAVSIGSRIMLYLPDARVEMQLSSPESRSRPKIDSEVFNFEYLVKKYRIEDVKSLDELAPAAGAADYHRP